MKQYKRKYSTVNENNLLPTNPDPWATHPAPVPQ